MRHLKSGITVVAFVLAGCGGSGTDKGVAAGSDQAAPAASNGSAAEANAAALAAAPVGNASASAETPVGPCPFATRGWEALIMPASAPGEQPTVSINGEIRADSGGRQPMIFNLGERQPPLLVLELTSSAEVEPQADRGFMANGAVFPDYTPQYTHVAIRCANTEIARVPIRPAY
jgi:hypothetical protein